MQNDTPSKRNSVSNRLVKIVAFGVLMLFVLWARAFYGSMKDYETGETFLKENQIIRAVTYFDRSLHWYAPFNPYMEKAALKLWEIGEKAEREGDRRMARIAFESIRNAVYGTSHLFTPGEEWIIKAESRIKALDREKPPDAGGQADAGQAKKSVHAKVGWSVAVVVGFLGWVACLFGLIAFVFRGKGDRKKTFFKRLVWLGLALAFAALWIAGMTMA